MHQTAFCAEDCNLYLQAKEHSREENVTILRSTYKKKQKKTVALVCK
jgi:hypothetical protein